MKKIFFAILFITLGLSGFATVLAQTDGVNPAEEAVLSFNANILVNTDNSVDVVETITYQTGSEEKHGIYRDIHPYSSEREKMNIKNVDVRDENNNPYRFETSSYNGDFRIKIGDPNTTFFGQRTFVVSYRATHAIAHLKDADEIYWNVTGNAWNMPIFQARGIVKLPNGADMIRSSCYFGIKGSTDKCKEGSEFDGTYVFDAPSRLKPTEGLTVALGFSKGIVAPYGFSDQLPKYAYWAAVILLPILSFLTAFLYWYKKGRDERGNGVIVPQYEVVDDLTPLEVGTIVKQRVNTDFVSAEIIYLAVKGYLKIEEIEENVFGFKIKDYKLIKLKDSGDLSNDFDRQLLDGLFSAEKSPSVNLKNIFKFKIEINDPLTMQTNSEVKLSELKKSHFFLFIEKIKGGVLSSLLSKQYYRRLGSMKNGGFNFVASIFVGFWVAGFFAAMVGFLTGLSPFPLAVSIFVSVLLLGIFSQLSPARTKKGALARESILGLKDYLQIAEKDRLEFHNAPERKPELFERLLPFAMVLGVSKIWAKEFEGIYTTPPSWYSGPVNANFNAIVFTTSLSKTFSSMTSSSSGGSGGGGSSGGGGGGGGGGSW